LAAANGLVILQQKEEKGKIPRRDLPRETRGPGTGAARNI
jgi:hypothetical protein